MSDGSWPPAPGSDSPVEVRIQADEVGGVPVLFVAGELDMTATRRVHDALTVGCSSTAGRLVVDVSNLAFMDVAGLRTVLEAHDRLLARGAEGIVVRGASGVVRRVFELTGFTSLLGDSLPVVIASHASPRGWGSGRELEQVRRRAGLSVQDLFVAYFALGGTADFAGLAAHLWGSADALDAHQRDVAAHALNECLADLGGTDHLLTYAADQCGAGTGS